MADPSSDWIELCPEDLRQDALGLLYQRVESRIRMRLVDDALRDSAQGVVDLSGLWVARRRGKLLGVLLTQELAGRVAAIWAPEVVEGFGRATVARRLLVAAVDHLRAKGIRLAQALLDGSATPRASADLARGGLPRVTYLDYLERDTAEPIAVSPAAGALKIEWTHFVSEAVPAFRTIIQATYQGSLDMPELSSVRSLDDVIAGHRAAGRFDPMRWQLGRVEGEPDSAIIVLLSQLPDRDAWEVAYLGLTPPARGRGLGRLALEHARRQAASQALRLELAVDRRNIPAVRLYESCGFHAYDRRAVHLAILGRG